MGYEGQGRHDEEVGVRNSVPAAASANCGSSGLSNRRHRRRLRT